jgi:hypothetical protein
MGSDIGRWIERAQDGIQLWERTSAVLNLRNQPPNSWLINKMGLRKKAVVMGYGWNWLKIVPSGGLW